MTDPMPSLPNLPSDWRERLVRMYSRLKLGDAALQMEKDVRRQKVTEHAIGQAYERAGMEKPSVVEEEMAINLGDTINYTAPPAPSPAAAPPTPPATPQPSSGLKTAALVAAAGLAGATAPYVLPAVGAALTPDPPAAVSFDDTDTQYQFRVVPELSGPRDDKGN